MDSSDLICGRLSLSSGLIGDGSGGTLDMEVSSQFTDRCLTGSAAGHSSAGDSCSCYRCGGSLVSYSTNDVTFWLLFLSRFSCSTVFSPSLSSCMQICRVYRFIKPSQHICTYTVQLYMYNIDLPIDGHVPCPFLLPFLLLSVIARLVSAGTTLLLLLSIWELRQSSKQSPQTCSGCPPYHACAV